MSSSEDYLDNLLNAVKNDAGETTNKPNNEELLESLQQLDDRSDELAGKDESVTMDDGVMGEPVIEDIMPEEPEINDLLMSEPAIEDIMPEEPEINDLLMSEPATEDALSEEPDINDLLMSEPVVEDSMTEEPETGEAAIDGYALESEDEEDVTSLIDSMPEDSELAEISDLLRKSDNNEIIDDDMLSLLENADHGAAEDAGIEDTSGDEPFDFFANESEELPVDENNDETPEIGVGAGRKRNSTADDSMQSEIDDLLGNSLSEEPSYNEYDITNPMGLEETGEENAADEASAEQTGKKRKERVKREKKKKEKSAETTEFGEDSDDAQEQTKKPGLFKKLFGVLFEEDDEPEEVKELGISEENQEILDEIEEEGIKNKKRGKKEKKKGKKEKKNGGNTEDASLEDDDEEAEENKKKKKPKKEKKHQVQEETEPEKKISVKKIIPIFLFCLTIMMIIIVLAMVVPSYQDLKNARNAYYQGDYESVYYDMYGKSLGESDDILYKRSVAVLTLQNYLDSYQMYLLRGKETEAVNELMMAVMFYDENVRNNADIGAINELEQTYQEILALLSANYDVSEELALEIVALEDLPYNKELYYLVYGVEFTVPGQEIPDNTAITAPTDVSGAGSMEDILTEEEDILNEQPEGNAAPDTTAESGTTDDSEPADSQNNGNQTENMENPDQNDESNVIYSGVVENGSAFMQ